MSSKYCMEPLSSILTQYQEYIDEPEPVIYPKLSVKLYGKGVTLDNPVDGSTLLMKKHQIAKEGQVILSEIWGKKGAIGIVPPEGDTALCTSHFFLFDVHEDKINPKYLQAIFTANYLEDQLNSEAQGTTGYAAVRPKHLLVAQIPLPPLEEQRRLVARIEEVAAKIEEARRLRQEAEKEILALKGSYINFLFSPSKNHNWTYFSLGEVADIRAGVTLGRTLNGSTINVPYLRVANVQDGHLDLNIVKEIDILPEELEKWKLENGDILLTEGGDWDKLGRGTIWKGEIPNCIHQNHIFRLRITQKDFDVNFLAAYISSPYGKAYFQKAAKKTTNLASINQTQLKALPVIKPPLEVQKEIVAQLDVLQSKINFLKRQQTESTAELDALLPSILDKAFKGEL